MKWVATILSVEDHLPTADLIRHLSAAESIKVVNATTADQTLRLTRKRAFDLILIDAELSNGSALDLCRALAGRKSLRAPIVFLSVFGAPKREQLAREAGATGYIVRPILPGTFAKEVLCHVWFQKAMAA